MQVTSAHLCHSHVASVGDRNSRMPWPKEASRYADCGGCVRGQYCPFCTGRKSGWSQAAWMTASPLSVHIQQAPLCNDYETRTGRVLAFQIVWISRATTKAVASHGASYAHTPHKAWQATCTADAACMALAQHWELPKPGGGAHLEGRAERRRSAGGLQAGGRGAVRLVDGLRLGALDIAAVPDQDVGGCAGVQIVLVNPVGPLRAKWQA